MPCDGGCIPATVHVNVNVNNLLAISTSRMHVDGADMCRSIIIHVHGMSNVRSVHGAHQFIGHIVGS